MRGWHAPFFVNFPFRFLQCAVHSIAIASAGYSLHIQLISVEENNIQHATVTSDRCAESDNWSIIAPEVHSRGSNEVFCLLTREQSPGGFAYGHDKENAWRDSRCRKQNRPTRRNWQT